jgi:hypothetical protein
MVRPSRFTTDIHWTEADLNAVEKGKLFPCREWNPDYLVVSPNHYIELSFRDSQFEQYIPIFYFQGTH